MRELLGSCEEGLVRKKDEKSEDKSTSSEVVG